MGSSPKVSSGSAQRHGRLWGARAREWAETEEQQLPTYDDALGRLDIACGSRVLEVGCGTGVFLRLAARAGASVVGLDAAAGLIAVARQRVPEAHLVVGDMEHLPFPDDSFDVVCGFNSFFFAADMVAALREARRVTRPGGRVLVEVWGRPERSDLLALRDAVAPLLPPTPPGVVPTPPLWEPGRLEGTVTLAGLAPETAYDLRYALEYPDEETLLRRLTAPGIVVSAIEFSGEDRVRAAIRDAMSAYGLSDGSFRLEQEWHFLIASA